MILNNKTIIITGSGRGIGEFIANRLAKEGANVVITSRTLENIQKVSKRIIDNGGAAIYIAGDVTSEKDVKNVIKEAIKKFGHVDVLVNNAGVGLRKDLRETKIDEFEEVMDVNVKGVFLYMKHIIPEMEKLGGLIINISSGAGKTGIPSLSVYCASKFAVIGLSEAAAEEVQSNIKIVALCPGSVNTGIFKRFFPGERADLQPEEVAEKVAEIIMHSDKYFQGQSIELY